MASRSGQEYQSHRFYMTQTENDISALLQTPVKGRFY